MNMTKNDQLNTAIEIAAKAHMGQKRFGNGETYILHPIRVMMNLETVDEKIVAMLHDVLEDTDLTAEKLEKAGFSKNIIEAITAMTKLPSANYEEYLQGLKKNKLARSVKIKDIEDNMNIFDLKKIRKGHLIRVEKYHAARLYLLGD